jgi:predicted O-methyltransferase YrrM
MKHFYEGICSASESMFNYQQLYIDAVKDCPDGGTIVEVGSWIGQSMAFLAVEAINSQKKIKLVSVDAFIGNAHNGDSETEFPQWEVFKKKLSPVWNDLVVIKSLSHLGADYFNSVDFVFIDADHCLEAVRKDIDAWWGKVRIGGTMAGHDYVHPPVRQAVDEFAEKSGLSYKVIGNCWYFKK